MAYPYDVSSEEGSDVSEGSEGSNLSEQSSFSRFSNKPPVVEAQLTRNAAELYVFLYSETIPYIFQVINKYKGFDATPKNVVFDHKEQGTFMVINNLGVLYDDETLEQEGKIKIILSMTKQEFSLFDDLVNGLLRSGTEGFTKRLYTHLHDGIEERNEQGGFAIHLQGVHVMYETLNVKEGGSQLSIEYDFGV